MVQHQKAILYILQKVSQIKMLQTSGLKQWMKKNIQNLNKTKRSGRDTWSLLFQESFWREFGNYFRDALGKKEAVIIGSCFLFTGTIMLFIYEHIVNSLFFSRKYVIIVSEEDFLWKNRSLHSYVWCWSHYQDVLIIPNIQKVMPP